MTLNFLDGNEAIARAAIFSGCNFFAGYPITPATSIFQKMIELLPGHGGICLQGEDEIASIGFCLGASAAGKKAMTATSGPGISLYSEQISFAIGSEIPLVIVDVQRLGPSTGSATKGADGDIQFMRWGNSGGLPVIVLAPVDIIDCYTLTVQAFNLAERYRCPVFIASNKEIGLTRESVDLDQLEIPLIQERNYCPEDQPFLPYAAPPNLQAPDFLPMGGQRLVRLTSSTHGPDGYITVDSEVIAAGITRMELKITSAVDMFTYFELDEEDEAETLLVSYGITARAARQGVEQLKHKGIKVSLLILKTLYPVPEQFIKRQISRVKKVVVVEMNRGQYVKEIERLSGNIPVRFYGRMDGELISPDEIREAVHS